MTCGFTILNYNTWELTAKLAMKVSNFASISYVIIIDNMSSDDSYENLQKLSSDKVIVLSSGKNGGYSYGNNIGLQWCIENDLDYVFISNPDVDIDEKDIKKILDGFGDKQWAVLSGVELTMNGDIAQPEIFSMPTYKSDLINCFYLGRKLVKNDDIKIDFEKDIQEVELVKGSFLAVRLSDFKQAGLFDDDVFLFCEERITGHRIKGIGKKLGIVTDAKYYHNHSVSIKKTYKSAISQRKLLFQSQLIAEKKYGNVNKAQLLLLRLLMKYSLLETSIAGKFLSWVKKESRNH